RLRFRRQPHALGYRGFAHGPAPPGSRAPDRHLRFRQPSRPQQFRGRNPGPVRGLPFLPLDDLPGIGRGPDSRRRPGTRLPHDFSRAPQIRRGAGLHPGLRHIHRRNRAGPGAFRPVVDAWSLSRPVHRAGGTVHPNHRGRRARPGGHAMNPYLLSQVPLIAGFVFLLILAAVRSDRRENLSGIISVLSLCAAAVFVWIFLPEGAQYFGGAIRVTTVGKVLAYLCLGLTAVGMVLSQDYLDKARVSAVDWRLVVMAMALGMVNLCLAGDLATLFISYELVSIPSYVLAGFSHKDPRSNEAGMKYLLLGVFTSVLFLLGLSFIYGATGEIHLSDPKSFVKGKI